MINELNIFNGPFKDILPKFINYQRAQGYDYGASIIYRYKELDDFFKSKNCNNIEINEDLYNEWISYRDGEKKTNQMRRVIAINIFSKYLINEGYHNIYINPNKMKFTSNFIPYIFSKEQIKNMYKSIDYLIDNSTNKNYISFKVLFSLYYTCGLRLSEAINLRFKDIDLTNHSIRIVNSKNHSNRLIVLSASMFKILNIYYDKVYVGNDNDFIFKNNINNQIRKQTVQQIFKEVLMLSNIPKRENQLGPRIHDLRHTFAINSLEQMMQKGFDMYTSLPILSKYLGHKGIKETEYYLRLIPKYHQNIEKLNNECFGKIFPEVEK